MNEDRPRIIERVQRAVAPEDAQRNRSNAMVTLGVVLFVLAGLIVNSNPDGGSMGAILFGMLGVGLLVGGLVIRR